MNDIVVGPQEILIAIVVGLAMLAVIAVLLIILVLRRPPRNDTAGFDLLQSQLAHLRDGLHEQLTGVSSSLTETNATARQMLGVAEQFERAMTHPKQRGNLGELALEQILNDILSPADYELQYRFPDGKIVDAAIKTPHGYIPVDAKFPLDNYRKLIGEKDPKRIAELEASFVADIKKRIAETSDYVRPRDGTLPFALMFVPAEGIYYDLLANKIGQGEQNLLSYALSGRNKVIIVSPTTFAAYLYSVLHGLKAYKIEKRTEDIRRNVESLAQHLKAFEELQRRLGNALSAAVNHFNASYLQFSRIDKDVVNVTGDKIGISIMTVENPHLDKAA
jgi:DNA recombination protein RmuC